MKTSSMHILRYLSPRHTLLRHPFRTRSCLPVPFRLVHPCKTAFKDCSAPPPQLEYLLSLSLLLSCLSAVLVILVVLSTSSMLEFTAVSPTCHIVRRRPHYALQYLFYIQFDLTAPSRRGCDRVRYPALSAEHSRLTCLVQLLLEAGMGNDALAGYLYREPSVHASQSISERRTRSSQ